VTPFPAYAHCGEALFFDDGVADVEDLEGLPQCTYIGDISEMYEPM
jgi:hypothetical protein